MTDDHHGEIEKSRKRVIARISYGSQSTQHTIIQGEIEKSWERVIARIPYGSQSTQHTFVHYPRDNEKSWERVFARISYPNTGNNNPPNECLPPKAER